MRARTGMLIGVFALIAVVVVGAKYLTDIPVAVAGTEALFAANFPDHEGKMQAFSQWRGKVLVVNFWATWCPPCREEMPELDLLQQKYRSRGLTVIGIATDDAAKVREFASDAKLGYSLLVADMDGMSLSASLGNDRSILPYTVIIDRQGKIISGIFGRINTANLEQSIQSLL